LAETDIHRDQLTDPLYAIRWHFRDDPGLYVSGNLLLLYDPTDRRVHVSPDLFVVRGVGRHRRKQYVMWEELKAPELVIEISSSSTWQEDMGNKRAVYARLGIREYYLFDPTGEYLGPRPLRAYVLAGDEYAPVVGTPVHSAALDLNLVVVDGVLRLADPATGNLLPIPMEAYQNWQEAQGRAEAEARRAEAAEKRAGAAEGRAGAAEGRAEAAEGRAEAAEGRAVIERARAEAAEERARALEAELRRLGRAEGRG
jgi:hypothetical protein